MGVAGPLWGPIFVMAELIIAPDPQISSKPIPKNVNSHRSRRNIQRTFDPSSNSLVTNYPLFFIVNFEGISSRQINPYNLIESVRDQAMILFLKPKL